jgi:ribose transport system substrate-binding protein
MFCLPAASPFSPISTRTQTRWRAAVVRLGCLATLVFAFAACSKPDANSGSVAAARPKAKALRIGMSFQELDNPYFAVMKQALDEAAGSIGAEVFVTDARHDVAKQISDIEDLIQKGVEILLINPTDSVGVEGAVRDAKKAGLTVVAIDAQASGPIYSFVGSKNYDAGRLAGEHLGKILDGRGEVAILDGIAVVPILERVRGFKDGIAKFPGLKLVDTQNGKQERSTALSVTENMLQSHPSLAGLFSVNDGGALGALAAITASGKKVALVSVDGLAEVVSAVVKGGPFKATVAQFPRDQIRIGLGIALAKRWGANVPREVPLDVKLLTPENAPGFAW